MVAIIRTTPAEDEHLSNRWDDWHRATDLASWRTTRPTRWWTGGHTTLVITGSAKGRPEISWLARSVKVRKSDDLGSRIEVTTPHPVSPPVAWQDLVDAVPSRTRDHLDREGSLPTRAGENLLEALLTAAPSLRSVVQQLEGVHEPIPITTRTRELLAVERDATITSVKMAGFDAAPLASWDLGDEGDDVPFVSRLQAESASAHEDDLITHDAGRFRAWLGRDLRRIGWKAFRRGQQQLFVYNANRKAAEETLGADLIYYHEARDSLVLIQYKKMEHHGSSPGEWRYYPDADSNLPDQIERLREIDAECERRYSKEDDYRLSPSPSWLKICRGQQLLSDATQLVPGMYLSRSHFEQLRNSIATKGPRNGTVFSYRTVPRYLNNTEFTDLVAGGWIGSAGIGSTGIKQQLDASLGGSREVIFAVVTGTDPHKAKRSWLAT